MAQFQLCQIPTLVFADPPGLEVEYRSAGDGPMTSVQGVQVDSTKRFESFQETRCLCRADAVQVHLLKAPNSSAN